MPHLTGPAAATITALDEKLTEADTDTPARCLQDQNLTPDNMPYWLVNVPPSQWTVECPSFLRNQSQKNIRTLSTPDTNYVRQNWEWVQEIVRRWSFFSSAHHGSGGTLLTKSGCFL